MNENENKLLTISVSLADISAHIKHISETVGKLDHQITNMDHTIRGNGAEGLVTKIAKIEQIEERRSKREWMIFGSILSLAIAVVSILLKSII
jgi:hypothetical protein